MPRAPHWDGVKKRLDLIIMLMMERGPDGGATSMTSKIQKLMAFGLRPVEVAQIVGKKVSYVTAVMAQNKPKKAAKASTEPPQEEQPT
jgi:hypothetical protein